MRTKTTTVATTMTTTTMLNWTSTWIVYLPIDPPALHRPSFRGRIRRRDRHCPGYLVGPQIPVLQLRWTHLRSTIIHHHIEPRIPPPPHNILDYRQAQVERDEQKMFHFHLLVVSFTTPGKMYTSRVHVSIRQAVTSTLVPQTEFASLGCGTLGSGGGLVRLGLDLSRCGHGLEV